MLDRLGGFVFVLYIFLVGGAAFAIVSAFTFATTITERHVSASHPRYLSRAEAQVRAAERSATRSPDKPHLLVPSDSTMSASALAAGLDKAEGYSFSDQRRNLAHRARVAGWVRRQTPSHKRRFRVAKESAGRVILRSLFAENERP